MFYYAWYLWCSRCKATYFNPDNRIFDCEKPDRNVKADTVINREFRSVVMDWFRKLASDKKPEALKIIKEFISKSN